MDEKLLSADSTEQTDSTKLKTKLMKVVEFITSGHLSTIEKEGRKIIIGRTLSKSFISIEPQHEATNTSEQVQPIQDQQISETDQR